MKNRYYNNMVELLMAHADGMRLGHIARTLYNADADLFDTDGADKYRYIYKTIQNYLWKQSQRKESPFERRKWGVYGLRRHFVIQLELCFDDWEDENLVLRYAQNNKKEHITPPSYHMRDLFESMDF